MSQSEAVSRRLQRLAKVFISRDPRGLQATQQLDPSFYDQDELKRGLHEDD